MPMIRRAGRATRSLPLLTLLTAIGCSSESATPDERLTDAARHALEQQSKQNEIIAGQAESVAQQSRQVAEAAKELVAKDAQARVELLAATKSLNNEVHTERRSLDRQYEKLDDERRQIAAQRHRDPIIAAVIEGFGLMLACLMPLVVCVLVLRQLRDETGDEKALAELLAVELTSDRPRLLPDASHLRGSPSLPAPSEDENEVEPPPY